MKKTRVCDLLEIQYPILQGGMLWLADADLAAAVSNSGGFGIISPLAGMERQGNPLENLKKQISRTRELTEKPFGVNIPLDLKYSGLLINALLEEKLETVITAAGDPSVYTELLLSQKIKVLHVVSSVKQALFAEDCNVSGLIAEGVEAGGHLGHTELPLFSLIPQVVDQVSIPVIAAGGIADSRGLVAAMALGAEGIQLGTRFIAVDENIAHPDYKKAILSVDDSGTMVTCRKLVPTRSLKTTFSENLLKLEESGASAEKIRDYIGRGRARAGQLDGDLTEGEAYSGASAGLIKEIIPAAMVVQELVNGYKKILRELSIS